MPSRQAVARRSRRGVRHARRLGGESTWSLRYRSAGEAVKVGTGEPRASPCASSSRTSSAAAATMAHASRDATGTAAGPKRLDRGAQRGTRCETVVDEHDRLAGEVGKGTPAPVEPLASTEFATLRLDDAIDVVLRQAEHRDGPGIHDADAATGDRADCVLLVARSSKLPDDEHIERSVERGSDLVADWHSAAGQGEDDDIRARGVSAQPLGEDPSGLAPVRKGSRHTRLPFDE